MSQNREWTSFADALQDAAADFKAPDTARLHDLAVRRGRQIKRRRAGAAVGGTVALGTAGVLAFTLSVAAGHGTAAAVNSGAPPAGAVSPSPLYTHPAHAPAIRSGEITASVIQDAVEYALPSGAQVVQTGGPTPNTNVEVVDTDTHSWYVQTAVTLKSRGQFGTEAAVSVAHTASSDTCSNLNQSWGSGAGQCTQSTVDGGQLLDEVVPPGVVSSSGVSEFFEWFSPAGYETDLQLGDTTVDDFALTKTQAEAVLTNQVFGEIAQALPADACVGGSFSAPVDPPSPGQSPLQHVRCSSDGNLYPTY